jgi:hypothetical protein
VPSKNAPPLPHPLLHRMEEREFGCGVRLLRTNVLKDRAFLTRKQRIKFSSSPREERVGRGLRRGAASKNDPPLPGPLLHPMEEREKTSGVRGGVAKPCRASPAQALETRKGETQRISTDLSQELPGIQNPAGVQCVLDGAMQLAQFLRSGQRPPRFLCQADAVFAGNHAAPGEHLAE